jgi:hypothetical protein
MLCLSKEPAMPETESDLPSRRAVRAPLLAFAVVAILAALAIRWLTTEERPAPLKQPAVEAPVDDGTDWETNARRFETEKAQAAAILTGADKVEPVRIEPLFEVRGGGLDQYPVVSRAPRKGHAFAVRLAALLLDPKSYLIPGQDGKMCIFSPRVAFRVWKRSKFVDVLICFDCGQLMVVENDPAVPLRSLGAKPARFRVGGDFDPILPELTKLVREAFPGEPSLEEVLNSNVIRRRG